MDTTSATSTKQFAIADHILQRGIDEGIYTHAVCAIALGDREPVRKAFGLAALDTVFDLASLTKPLSTATGILQLVEQGKLHLGQRVPVFFEDTFGPLPHLVDITLHHLLTHTSGLPPIPNWPQSLLNVTREDLIRSALSTLLLDLPGTSYVYSDTGYILLGEIVAKISGISQADFFRDKIAAPLGLTSTVYCPPEEWHERIAPTGKEAKIGEVHDPRARDLGGICGHAGLFGTADDVLRYAETIRQGGRPVLSAASVARMRVSQIPVNIGGQSYGWFCLGNDYLPKADLFSDRAFGHSGFTGTMMLIDPEHNVSVVLLTNRVMNESREDGARFLKLRRMWCNAVAGALDY